MTSRGSQEELVLDASAMVELLVESATGSNVEARIADRAIHVPAHFDAEVLSALGRMNRAGVIHADLVATKLRHLSVAPLSRHLLPMLVSDAWERRHNLRLVDGIYVALAEILGAPLITTDASLASAVNLAEYVGPAT